ncbi:hypothetical protein J5N97_005669 [Dioscorea zingiberensis]|uniref:t-SNARE coiled-coil homology domain-containing protein n=1 Tax=Dioscorea zingiberensis TaxID=325984 RepID=A0A9D5D8S8_9LILI|nr:hypothetical protein J5N97_005669 [Dioscorea zingiberensis]
MNDLMTKSFLSYVELKKQALKDQEANSMPDLEAGGLTKAEEENLSRFFQEVGTIQEEMEAISNLLLDLQDLNEESKSAHSAKVLRGLRDRMDSDMLTILKKAQTIKVKLEVLDRSNTINRDLSACFGEGGPVDRTRMSITNGLRTRLREMMHGFQSLRETILANHKEHLKRKYYTATGEVATEEVIEKMLAGSCQVGVVDQKGKLDIEMHERQRAVSEIQKSLMRLHQVFLDMAVMVDAQEEKLNDIEENVVSAKDYISGGTNSLASAQAMKNRGRKWTCWIWILVVVVLMKNIYIFLPLSFIHKKSHFITGSNHISPPRSTGPRSIIPLDRTSADNHPFRQNAANLLLQVIIIRTPTVHR